MAFEAIVLDFDGLIFDTETYVFLSMQELFADYGIQFSLEDWCKCIETVGPYKLFQQRLQSRLENTDIAKMHEEKYRKLISDKDSRPGVKEYLQKAKELGLRIAIASNNKRTVITEHLQMLNLEKYFDCIVCSEDVVNKKPNPEVYLRVLDHLNVSPSQAIAFEDAHDGALAAKRAGMFCVLVPNMVSKNLNNSNQVEVDMVLESMADMEFVKLIYCLGQ